uniref:Cystatin domain-containing protein n=1 Tax=Poecilia formosa TaxID=48698 RepID=A0A096M5W3_POEFO
RMNVPMGEWSDVRFTTSEVEELCDKVKIQVAKKTGKDFKEYKPVFYRVKNILVYHYIIKVYVGADYLHLLVSKRRSTSGLIITLMAVEQHHKWDDPLKPF